MKFILKEKFRLLILNYYNSEINKHVFLIRKDVDITKVKDITNRYFFYFNSKKDIPPILEFGNFITMILLNLLSKKVKFIFGFKVPYPFSKILHYLNFFDVDYEFSPDDGWKWHLALNTSLNSKIEVNHAKIKFNDWYNSLASKKKSYILGTGPSLSNAINIDWSDGYRIVCNTIVRDEELWKHVEPNAIVAADAIYHFGHNSFARAFINDLKVRLRETPSCVFIYPYIFHAFVNRELKEFEKQLIPIPLASDDNICRNLLNDFRVPSKRGNILNILLLPIGSFLSKNVYLLGFDGRNPNDTLFWKNSSKHTYDDKLIEIVKAHPKFFDFHLPKNNPLKYVEIFHGEYLENALKKAEKQGWKYIMMHKSWTPTLNKRYKDNNE